MTSIISSSATTFLAAAAISISYLLHRKKQKPIRIEGIVFDLDGTLIDYEGASHEALALACKKYGATFTWALHAKIVGMQPESWAKIIIDELNMSEKGVTVQQYIEDYFFYIKKLYSNIEKWPGTMNLLNELASRGYPMAIATSSPRYSFDIKMKYHEDILEFIDAIVTGDEIVNGKPNPDIFLEACRRLNVNPKNVVIFEDSPFGVMGAKSAGAYTVALPDPRLIAGTKDKYPRSTWTLEAIGKFNVNEIQRIDRNFRD
jgi:pseudouridine 5'-phosphatase